MTPVCRHCDTELILGKTWTVGHKRNSNYRCRACCKAQNAAYYKNLPKEGKERRNRRFRDWARTAAGQYGCAKKAARWRGVPWCLTREQYAVLRAQPCTYCGGSLPDSGSGLDQRVAGKGYTLANAIPCCAVCNRVKLDVFCFSEMKLLGVVVRQIMEAR